MPSDNRDILLMFSIIRSKQAFASWCSNVPASFCKIMISFVITVAAAVSAAFLPGRPPACSGDTCLSMHVERFSLYVMSILELDSNLLHKDG